MSEIELRTKRRYAHEHGTGWFDFNREWVTA